MIFLVVLFAAILVAFARGGKLSNLGQLNFRWSGFIFAGFLIQLVVFQSFWQDNAATKSLTPAAYVISLILLLLPLLANLRLPGVTLLALGLGLNFIAIALNGGYMPASPEAVALAGRTPRAPGQVINNSIGAGPETRALFLTDIFAIPSPLPFANVFSVGDVLIAIGGFYLVQQVMAPAKSQS